MENSSPCGRGVWVYSGTKARAHERAARRFLEWANGQPTTAESLLPGASDRVDWVVAVSARQASSASQLEKTENEGVEMLGCAVIHRLRHCLHLSIARVCQSMASGHQQQVAEWMISLLTDAMRRGAMLQVRVHSAQLPLFLSRGFVVTHLVQHRGSPEHVLVYAKNEVIPHLARSLDERNPSRLQVVPPCGNPGCDRAGVILCDKVRVFRHDAC